MHSNVKLFCNRLFILYLVIKNKVRSLNKKWIKHSNCMGPYIIAGRSKPSTTNFMGRISLVYLKTKRGDEKSNFILCLEGSILARIF